jgi:hypothetical protein
MGGSAMMSGICCLPFYPTNSVASRRTRAGLFEMILNLSFIKITPYTKWSRMVPSWSYGIKNETRSPSKCSFAGLFDSRALWKGYRTLQINEASQIMIGKRSPPSASSPGSNLSISACAEKDQYVLVWLSNMKQTLRSAYDNRENSLFSMRGTAGASIWTCRLLPRWTRL